MERFNASISVTELLTKTLENVAKDLARRCIEECAVRHGFDAATEIRDLGLENLNLIKKQMSKKSGGTKKVAKEAKTQKVKKSSIPMPFNASEVSVSCCQGLSFNRGLFTQCQKNRMENGDYCTICQGEADQNASGTPNCGTVEQRLAKGLYEFKDGKGRSPVSYVKLLEKLGHTKSSVELLSKNIESEHFEVVEKVSKSHRGRPKKASTSIVAEEVNDLFQQLSPDAEEESESVIMEEKPKKEKVSKKMSEEEKVSKKMSEEEKEAKKAALEQEREAKKAALEQEREAKKEEREAARLAEKEQKRQEKEAKIAEEKAAKELKRQQEKEEEKAAKELKRQQEKEAAKSTKKPVTKKAKEVTAEPVDVAAPVTPAPTKVTVTRVTIDGVEYLKSSANILYNITTKEEVGLYDPVTKTMKELPEESDEEEEEDYEEEDA
jgi:myosin heavy subunit